MNVLSLVLFALAGSDDKAAEEALEKFKAAYKSPSPAQRAEAVKELARTQHEKIVARLGSLLVSDEEVVRVAAAAGLGVCKDHRPKAANALLAGLGANARAPDVAAAILLALGTLGDEKTIGVIHGHFEDKDTKIAAGALQACGLMGRQQSVEALLAFMRKAEKIANRSDGGGAGGFGGLPDVGGGGDPQRQRARTLLPVAVKAMQAISKEKYETVQEWEIWWNKRKAAAKKR